MSAPIDNAADLIDSREIIERLEDLNSGDYSDLTDEERAELADLDLFATDAHQTSDWEYGATFIRDSYFEDYARELAEDIGAIPDAQNAWPTYCIDWEWAARELRMDYSAYEFGGVTYWARD